MPGNDGRTRVRVPDDWCPQGAPDVRTEESDLVHAHLIKALEAHVETLKEQLSATEVRFAELDARHVAEIAIERERADKAIAALGSLANELRGLAEERARPWWRRRRLMG
jgi:hypothetical protein